jgi:AcrR family transcriptional regulator
MGKLIDQARRARAKEARHERKALIKKAALELLDRQPLSEVTLNGVGRRAGLRDGLPTLYFGSLEELHLQLVSDEIRAWLEALGKLLDRTRTPLDAVAVAALLRRSIESRSMLRRLLTQLSVVVEQTSDVSAALAFQHGLEQRLAEAGERLEQVCQELDGACGRRLLHRCLLLLAGLGATGRWLDSLEPDLQVDVGAELEVLLQALVAAGPRPASPTGG